MHRKNASSDRMYAPFSTFLMYAPTFLMAGNMHHKMFEICRFKIAYRQSHWIVVTNKLISKLTKLWLLQRIKSCEKHIYQWFFTFSLSSTPEW